MFIRPLFERHLRATRAGSTPWSRRATVAALLVLTLVVALLAGRAATPARGAERARSSSRSITHIEYAGTVIYVGHYRHPGDVHVYHSLQQFATDGAGRARLDWTTWQEGDTLLEPETFVVSDDRVVHRDRPGEPWKEYTGARARQQRLQAIAGLPDLLRREARIHRDSLLELRVVRGRLLRYTRLQAHPRLGDVRDSVEFEYASANAAPDSISMALYERDGNWRLTGHRTSWSSAPVADSLLAMPSAVQPAEASGEGPLGPTVAPFTAVAPGLWSADLTDIDSRTLIAEFADHLAVIEVAVGSANGERIVDAARRRWPDKPVRFALFSHYHPHYAGGLRALIAEGATVVTTPGNEAFVRRVAELPFHLQPDRLARHPRPVQVVTFADRYELQDSTNRLVAINYGARSDHTDEFVVFWFPRQRLLFESELGWVQTQSGLRASSRAKKLLAWADEQHLDVERLVQSWPMRDNEAMVTRARLDSLVQARR